MITVNNLVHHEFIGLSVSVTSVSNKSLRLKGTVIDETKNTIKIEVDDVEKIIPKKGSIFIFELPTGEKVEINGIFFYEFIVTKQKGPLVLNVVTINS